MNPAGSDAVPPGVVTATSTTPAMPEGVTAVSAFALLTTMLVASAPPSVTSVEPATKFVPVTGIAVPPELGPVAGDTAEIVGGTTRPLTAASASTRP